MNRSLPAVLVVIVVAALAFVLLSPRLQPASSPVSSNPPVGTPPSGPQASSAPTIPTSLRVLARTLEGSIDLPLEGEKLRVAVLIGDQHVADVPAPGGKFRLTLPAALEKVPLNALSDVPLPHGEGHLHSSDGALAASAKIFAYLDTNGNARLDEGESSVEASLSKAGTAVGLMGFFKHQLVLTSKAASLNEAQDSRTGAKAYYRYALDLSPGWHVLEGEFGSNGYDVREATGSGWDLVVPFKPTAPGPKTPQQ